jgi:hypothetical protein
LELSKTEIPARVAAVLRLYFHIIREFVILHEWAHLAVRDPEFRAHADGNLAEILHYIADSGVRRDRQELPPAGLFDPGNRICRIVEHMQAVPSEREEMLVDITAIIQLIDTELGAYEAELGTPAPDATAGVLATINDALTLLFLMQATMNTFLEIFKPKSIRNGFDITRFESIKRLQARHDVRGAVCAVLSAHRLGRNLEMIAGLTDRSAGLSQRYIGSQLVSQQDFRSNYPRDCLLREDERLQQQLTYDEALAEAAQYFGYAAKR